ncbi:MAG: FMN-binding protein [Thermosipho sp. (in: Bacteria)]|nr:FMN-binding protein [Thermosipho sp. (in: thermotogales)]
MNKESKLYVVLFTFIISFIFIFVLSLINAYTIEKIELNREFSKVKAILSSAGIQFFDKKDALEKFNNLFIKKNINGVDFYIVDREGKEIFVYVFSGNGLWGLIEGAIATNKTVDQIIGIEIIAQNETPGLGGRIEEEWFKEQFKNEKLSGSLKLIYTGKQGDDDKTNSAVDAITGATLTSKFFVKIINDSIEIMRSALRSE